MGTSIPGCVSEVVVHLGKAANLLWGKNTGCEVLCVWTVSSHIPAHPVTKVEFFLPAQFGPSCTHVGQLEGWAVSNAGAVFLVNTVVQLVPSASRAAGVPCSLPASHWNSPKSQALGVSDTPMHLLLDICTHTCSNGLCRSSWRSFVITLLHANPTFRGSGVLICRHGVVEKTL